MADDNNDMPTTASGEMSSTAGSEMSSTASGEMSLAQLREWLRNWVAEATGQPLEQITVDRPIEEFGLASRDAVALSGDIEELTGVTLTATVAYQHPTIASLAERILYGEPEPAEDLSDEDYYLSGPQAGEAHDIAIVGLATRLPGGADTPESTWDFLRSGGDAIRELPAGRWAEFLAEPRLAAAIAEANTRGGYLSQDVITDFDAEFFAMSPIEVTRVDPQQRLLLELTWEALEHARIPASALRGESVGVFVGSSTNDFQLIAALGLGGEKDPDLPVSAEAYAIMGSSTSILANRVSYFFDFRGPSVTVDTACSSSLVAVHQAVRALREGEAEVALAGGVNMLLAPMATLGFDKNGAVAKDGRIKAFSADADGMVRSEGAGVVVLKRLADAQRDGDRILAVVKGSAVGSDGRSNGLIAPNPEAQVDVLRRAYRDAGIRPSDVDYIEAHGTGTLLGDPIEADALARVVGVGRDGERPALLGSAKTNFGHLESAAGAASLAKVLLAFENDVLPPNINFSAPNPYIPFEQAHLQVVEKETPFPRYSGTATVGISGFGFGGTNAHLVLQEYRPAEAADVDCPEETVEPEWSSERAEPLPVLLPVSAYLPSRRRKAAAEVADWLESEAGQDSDLADVARALAKRSHWRSRAVVVAQDREQAVAGLRAVAAGKPAGGVFTSDAPAAQGPVWVLAGFGAHHRKMAKQLYGENAIFRREVDRVDELVQDEAGYSIRDMFLDDAQNYDVGTSQVGIFTVQVGLAAVLRAHGAQPAAVVGHSMGEAAAAYIAGGLLLEDAVRVICARSRLMGEGEQMLTDEEMRHMALVEYSAEDVAALLPEFPDVEVAVYAAPTNTVIGGPPEQIEKIVERVTEAGKFARVLPTRGAGHTSQMDPLLGELAAELAGIEPSGLRVGLFSTVDQGKFYRPGKDPVHDVDYWVRNMRHCVHFAAAIRTAIDQGHTTFLELAPNSVALMQVLGTTYAAGVPDALLIPTLKRKEDESVGVLQALAQLYVAGHAVDMPSLLPAGEYADIPRTSFVRKRYWPTVRAVSGVGGGSRAGVHMALPDGRHVWQISAGGIGELSDLIQAAAAEIIPDAQMTALREHAPVPQGATVTTTLTPHLGGAAVEIHAQHDGEFRLLCEAVLRRPDDVLDTEKTPPHAADTAQDTPTTDEQPAAPVDFGARWDPDSGQTVEDRLALIVAEAMGYAPEDLPMEIPLMELGLDSLMAMRIKNRVEYEFDIPQLQISAVRDASLSEVARMLHYAVANKDQVQAIAEQQAAAKEAGESGEITVDEDFVAAAKAAMASGEDPAARVAQLAAGQIQPAPETATPQAADRPAEPVPAPATTEDVPPRDNAERLTFASWAMITGESAKGIFNTLPILEEDTAEKLAARLSERTGGDITTDDVLEAETIEELAEIVREVMDAEAEVDGLVRALRPRPAGSQAIPVFVFHPSGGNTLVYEPLLKRLPAHTPMYGLERTDGSIDERARAYLPELRAIQGDGPYVLYGWSLGAVLALAVAQHLRAEGADVKLVGLIDLAIPSQPEDNSPEERLRRMQRYQAFAKKTYAIEGELAPEQLRELADASPEKQFQMVSGLMTMSGAKIPAGVLEHQKTSWLENRALQQVQPTEYAGPVVLYLADRYHDGMIELEPRYASRLPNGGWDDYLSDLQIIRVPGDHLQIIDEPRIAVVGGDLTARLEGAL